MMPATMDVAEPRRDDRRHDTSPRPDPRPDPRTDPIAPDRPGADDDPALRQAMALGHLDIQPFDSAPAAASTFQHGFAAHDARAALPAGARRDAPAGITIEAGATATVESIEFVEMSPSIMARLRIAAWASRDGLRISAERLLPPLFRGRVCAYVTNIGRDPVTLPTHARLITIEVRFLSDACPRRDGAPRHAGGEPSARTLELAAEGHAAARGAGATVRIDDLDPMPFALRHAIFIALDERAGAFHARFAEADVEITGATPRAAIAGLKSLIVVTYEDLIDVDPAALDPRRRRQRRVLADLLRYDGAAEI